MSIQSINIGNIANDGTGDDLRTAFAKINENFSEIDNRQAQNNTVSNVGSGIGLYKEKVGSDLRFKSLIAGVGIAISSGINAVTINNNDHDMLLEHDDILNAVDFGKITTGTNVIQVILQALDIDLGTVILPSSLDIDGGSFV